MNIEFNDFGNTANIIVNQNSIALTQTDVQSMWWQTADLHDNNHSGSAVVTIGSKGVALTEPQWKETYIKTNLFINKFFLAEIDENKNTVH